MSDYFNKVERRMYKQWIENAYGSTPSVIFTLLTVVIALGVGLLIGTIISKIEVFQ